MIVVAVDDDGGGDDMDDDSAGLAEARPRGVVCSGAEEEAEAEGADAPPLEGSDSEACVWMLQFLEWLQFLHMPERQACCSKPCGHCFAWAFAWPNSTHLEQGEGAAMGLFYEEEPFPLPP